MLCIINNLLSYRMCTNCLWFSISVNNGSEISSVLEQLSSTSGMKYQDIASFLKFVSHSAIIICFIEKSYTR